MAAIANNPKFAKKAGVPQSVGEDFVKADKKVKKYSGKDGSQVKGGKKTELQKKLESIKVDTKKEDYFPQGDRQFENEEYGKEFRTLVPVNERTTKAREAADPLLADINKKYAENKKNVSYPLLAPQYDYNASDYKVDERSRELAKKEAARKSQSEKSDEEKLRDEDRRKLMYNAMREGVNFDDEGRVIMGGKPYMSDAEIERAIRKQKDIDVRTNAAYENYERRRKSGEMSEYKKGGAVKKNWIKSAIKKPGALRESLGVKSGEKIPAKKLASAAKKPGKMGQRARLAQTLKGFSNGGVVRGGGCETKGKTKGKIV